MTYDPCARSRVRLVCQSPRLVFFLALQYAYGTGHEQGLSKKTLEKMEKKRCFQTDHILGCNCDGSPNFFFMFQSLNNQFSFQTLQQFKKFYTGTAWDGIVSYVDKAYQMQWSYGRRF